jgi:deoxyribose-phosphate aldolase
MSEKLAKEVALLIDISCVRSYMTKKDISDMADVAKKYSFICAHVLPSNVEYLQSLLKDDDKVKVGSPVGFPSGGSLTKIKVEEMKELVKLGCDEIDIVLNVGWLCSGMYDEVEDDLRQIVSHADGVPTKIILETALLNDEQIKIGSTIAEKVGAKFAKTGTGWIAAKTTYENISSIKEAVGNGLEIKASGGIRNLNTLVKMYKMGVTRFGVGYQSAIDIINECLECDENVTLDNYRIN